MDLDSKYFRNDVVQRSLGGPAKKLMIGAGFLLKPHGTRQHFETRFKDYSGVLVLRGFGHYIDWKGREHPISPGCFFQRLPGRLHSTIHPDCPDWAECFVDFSQSFAQTLAESGSLDLEKPVLNPGLNLALIERFDWLVNALRGAVESELPRLLAGIHLLIVDIYARDQHDTLASPTARKLEAAAQRLATDSAERVMLPELAEELGFGYESFRKDFRARFGVSPNDYRIRRRVERARSLLEQGELTVKEVAHELGYANAFVFSRQFRQLMGVPPSSFRLLR